MPRLLFVVAACFLFSVLAFAFLRERLWTCETNAQTVSYGFKLPPALAGILKPTRRVIFLGFDGFGASNFARADMPVLHAMAQSSLAGNATTDVSVVSGPNWYGMLSGLNSRDSNVCSNGEDPSHRPLIFDKLRERGLTSRLFSDWAVLGTYGVPRHRENVIGTPTPLQWVSDWRALIDDWVDLALTDLEYDFNMLYFGQLDYFAHSAQMDEYAAFATHLDAALLQPLKTYADANHATVVVCADHGMVSGGHATNTEPVPLIIQNGQFAPLPEGVGSTVVASIIYELATVLRHG